MARLAVVFVVSGLLPSAASDAGQSNMFGNVLIAALPPEFNTPPNNVSLIFHGKPSRIGGGKIFGPEVSFAAAGPLYRPLLEEYAAAVKDRPARLTAILWMQGESDTRYPALGPNDFENLKTRIAAFRHDLHPPDLPFFFGRVNMPADALGDDKNTIKFPYIEHVLAARERAAREIPGVNLIETDDLGKQSGRIHYDAAGQITLGRRFAEAWLASRP